MLAEIPQRNRILVQVGFETGVRGGELAALRPVDFDLVGGEVYGRRVVLEVSKKITGADKVWIIRDYPKDNEHRTIRIGEQLCPEVREHLMATGKRGVFSWSADTISLRLEVKLHLIALVRAVTVPRLVVEPAAPCLALAAA